MDRTADPLLDAPEWAPSWLPSARDPHGVRLMRWVIGAILFLGLAACIAEGANSPADPELGAPVGSLPGRLAGAFGQVLATVVSLTGEVTEWCLLVADEPAERSRGLMEVTDLEGFDGMVFAYDADQQAEFYMYRTVTPLDLGWFRSDGTFVGAVAMAPCGAGDPDDCPTFAAPAPFRYAVEVFSGSPQAAAFADARALGLGGSCHPRSS